jgi:hypothetical protein
MYRKHKSALALGELTMTRLRAVKISNPLQSIVTSVVTGRPRGPPTITEDLKERFRSRERELLGWLRAHC